MTRALATILLALLALAPRAFAQDADPRPDAADPAAADRGVGEPDGAVAAAAEAFAHGQRAAAEERYDDALEHFALAQELFPHDAVRFNVAVCLEHLGRLRAAWLEYRALAESAALDDTERAAARAHAALIEERLAVVRVVTSEPAQVRLDGVVVGDTPLETRIEPGPHVVAARIGARESHRELVAVTGAHYDVRLVLPPAMPSPVQRVETRRVPRDPSWATWLGGGLAIGGGAAIIGFGVHAQSIHDAYENEPARTFERMREGELAVGLTNGAIAIASAGAILVAIDLVLLATGDGSREVAHDATSETAEVAP